MAQPAAQAGLDRTRPGVELLSLPRFVDGRGSLVVGELDELPIEAARFFVVTDVPAGAVRAQHANRSCTELLIALRGAVTIEADDGRSTTRVRLDRPDAALLVPAGIWLVCRDFTADAALLVLADRAYDPADRIGDHAQFRAWVARQS